MQSPIDGWQSNWRMTSHLGSQSQVHAKTPTKPLTSDGPGPASFISHPMKTSSLSLETSVGTSGLRELG